MATHPILELGRTSPRRKHLGSCSTTGSSDCSSKSLSMDQSTTTEPPLVSTLVRSFFPFKKVPNTLVLFSTYEHFLYLFEYGTLKVKMSFFTVIDPGESNSEYRIGLFNHETSNYIAGILWMAGLL